MMNGNNLYKIDNILNDKEHFHLLYSDKNIRIERIISFGQVTRNNVWLDQKKDEWVILLQGKAEILFENNINKASLKKGDYILIPSHCKHRITFTSSNPPCIWLAIHFNENSR